MSGSSSSNKRSGENTNSQGSNKKIKGTRVLNPDVLFTIENDYAFFPIRLEGEVESYIVINPIGFDLDPFSAREIDSGVEIKFDAEEFYCIFSKPPGEEAPFQVPQLSFLWDTEDPDGSAPLRVIIFNPTPEPVHIPGGKFLATINFIERHSRPMTFIYNSEWVF